MSSRPSAINRPCTPSFTMHSLRRGGARYLQDRGVAEPIIARHVGWKSNAMYDYINLPGHRQAFNALKDLS